MFISSKNYLFWLLSVLLIYGCNANTSEQNKAQKIKTASHTQASQSAIKVTTLPANPFESKNYPQPDCGDPLPQNAESYPVTYYPVYAENVGDNLSLIRSQLCQDAFAKILPGSGKVIQVASFHSREQADLFRQFLAKRTSGQGLIGKPSTIGVAP